MTAELRTLNARFINNFITNDVAGHDAILHEGFICITPTGARVGRADYLKAWATGFDAGHIPYFDYRDEKIDVFGDTALVRSTNRCVRMNDGVETVGMTMYTDNTFATAANGSASRRRSRRWRPPTIRPTKPSSANT